MPPQSDKERLKEIKARIHDKGVVTVADADALFAMREKITGEPRENIVWGNREGKPVQGKGDSEKSEEEKPDPEQPQATLTDMASADAFIADLESAIEGRDKESTEAAGNTADDHQGSYELGTDAVHRGADQSADDKPEPDKPVEGFEKEDEPTNAEEASDGDSPDTEDTDNPDDAESADLDSDNADDSDTESESGDDTGDDDTFHDSDANEVGPDEVDAEGKPRQTKAKSAKKAKAAKTGRKK